MPPHPGGERLTLEVRQLGQILLYRVSERVPLRAPGHLHAAHIPAHSIHHLGHHFLVPCHHRVHLLGRHPHHRVHVRPHTGHHSHTLHVHPTHLHPAGVYVPRHAGGIRRPSGPVPASL